MSDTCTEVAIYNPGQKYLAQLVEMETLWEWGGGGGVEEVYACYPAIFHA